MAEPFLSQNNILAFGHQDWTGTTTVRLSVPPVTCPKLATLSGQVRLNSQKYAYISLAPPRMKGNEMLDDLIGKITCADCLDILKQLPDKCVDLVLTDPPYNASNSKIKNEAKSYKAVNENWDKDFSANAFLDVCYSKLKDNGSMIVFCSYHTLSQYLNYDKMKIQQIIHWVKKQPISCDSKGLYTKCGICCMVCKR